MNLDEIEKKCFILALFIRDDGERFLLGSRMFEFVDSQLHFSGNNYQNDIVEVQGNDGVMLAGQVRRGSSQAFDGYIGDSSVDRSTIEQYRRSFFQFFRKNHYYKVVYIFTDGTAIQRRQGFIVEAPEVKELYQLFPQYHISMNFEDINYYNYEEDSEGQEIYGESATLKVITSATGGLIWEAASGTTISGEGSNFTLQDTIEDNVLESVTIKGDTTQQTYSGKNLLDPTTIIQGHINGGTPANRVCTRSGDNIDVTGGNKYSISNNNDNIRVNVYAYNSSATLSYESGWQSMPFTFTAPNDSVYLRLMFRFSNDSNITPSDIVCQVEASASATSYEPYVGGIASPNPDYPQTVNTVTGRQVVTIADGDSQSQTYEVNLGKNLLPVTMSSQTLNDVVFTVNADKSITMNGLASARTEPRIYQSGAGVPQVVLKAGVTYHNSMDTLLYLYTGSYRIISNNSNYTPTSDEVVQYAYIRVENGKSVNTTIYPMLEKGSTATTYAPYFTPIELCKIGTYQDYIYKSSGNWYVHKEIGKYTFTGSEVVGKSGNANNNSFYYASSQNTGAFGFSDIDQTIIGNNIDSSVIPPVYSSNFTSTSPIAIMNTSIAGITFNKAGSGIDCRLGFTLSSSVNTAQLLTTWLTANTPSVYYPIATPTDTQITNADLIAQLEALAGATTYDGQTVFTVSSPNQLAILNVSVIAVTNGGVVWDNYGAEWEEGTGGGPTMIDIESIDNVYPVWELTGPAVNPQISVLNTNTTLSYTGTVTASQTLKIDMFNKTATLNGASVIGNVSGDWVYLEPWINRLTYTTSNADAPDSTIWWQEIVG